MAVLQAGKKLRRIQWRMVLGGAALFGGVTYGTYWYWAPHKEAAEAATAVPEGSKDIWRVLADKYDKAVGAEETWMGYGILRWWYLQYAQGNVLEISAGTGRNLPHYPYKRITQLTLTDTSRPMLKRAEDKYFEELRLGFKHPNTRITFAVSDAHCLVAPQPEVQQQQPDIAAPQPSFWQRLGWSGGPGTQPAAEPAAAEPEHKLKQPPPVVAYGGSIFNIFRALIPGGIKKLEPHEAFIAAHEFDDGHDAACCQRPHSTSGEPLTHFPTASFDTVVDTFGLCSHDNPVQVLREAARVCKPDGKIILLEHGRAHGPWMNGRLDNGAHDHRKKWGCWWNRDINHIILEAECLDVEQSARWHFGTTYIFVAKPAKHIAAATASGDVG